MKIKENRIYKWATKKQSPIEDKIKEKDLEVNIEMKLFQISLDVERKIRTGEIKTIQDIHNEYYNDDVKREMMIK